MNYFFVAGEEFGENGDGSIGMGSGAFPIKGFDYFPQRFGFISVYWILRCCGGFVR